MYLTPFLIPFLIVTLRRGTEWAATGKVAQTKVPDDFPTAPEARVRKDLLPKPGPQAR